MDKERIENAIRHIQTATDIDPWAMEIAVDAMQRMMNVDGDLISRQAVKEWLARWEGYIDADTIARMQCRVVDIPSAQPDLEEDEDIPIEYFENGGV